MASLAPFLVRSSEFIWRSVADADADADARILEGVASTSSIDLAGDQVVPRGATYTLPMPLLMQHDRARPVGKVLAAKVTDTEITVRAQLARDTGLAYVDDAWKQLKAGLVKGFSIGAQPLKAEPIFGKDGDMTGIRYTAWRWLELSAVTVPMNDESQINVLRMFGLGKATRGDPMADMTGAERERQSYEATRARAMAAQAITRRALYRRDSP